MIVLTKREGGRSLKDYYYYYYWDSPGGGGRHHLKSVILRERWPLLALDQLLVKRPVINGRWE